MTDSSQIKQNANGVFMLEGEQLWDSDILSVCLEHIKEGDTVIDAGAWIGGHTMAYANKVGIRGMVYSFEPNPYAFQCLLKNTHQFPNVLSFQLLLGDERGIATFSAKKGWYDSGYMGDNHKIADVPMETLDFANIAPNFIKIDVEGCELKVLKGAAKTIEKFRSVMMIEINHAALKRQGDNASAIHAWLWKNKYGYQIIEKDFTLYTEVFNILCTPK